MGQYLGNTDERKWSLVRLCVPALESCKHIVVPWNRADVKAASAHVLDHLHDGDAIRGNDWTHAWYFRHLGSVFSLQPFPPDGLSRVWIVYTAEFPLEQRRQEARSLLPFGWEVAEERQFPSTTVLQAVPRRVHPVLTSTAGKQD